MIVFLVTGLTDIKICLSITLIVAILFQKSFDNRAK